MSTSNPKSSWNLKKIIKKAADVKYNTAIALSKSLVDEEKAKKRRAKKCDIVPLHLMKEPNEVKEIINNRLFNVILKTPQQKLTNVDLVNGNRIWNKASLYCNIKPGDLSYDNVNMSEMLTYYVAALMPPISPSKVREGEKILNMSLIPGRERSFLFTKNKKTDTEKENSVLNDNDYIDDDFMMNDHFNYDDSFRYTNLDCSMNLSTEKKPLEEKKLSSVVEKEISANDLKQENVIETDRFLRMFNNCKHSDMFLLLKSGDILYLHRFVLAAWLCDDDPMKEPQHFILDIDDEVVLKFFKHLYSNGKFNINDIIDGEDCLKLCKMFGLDHSTLVKFVNKNDTNDSLKLSFNDLSFSNEKTKSSASHITISESPCSCLPTDTEPVVSNENVELDLSNKFLVPPSDDNFNIPPNIPIQSTPLFAQRYFTNLSSPISKGTPFLNASDKLSDRDLFESMTQISFSENLDENELHPPRNDSIVIKNDVELIQKTSPEGQNIYKELCLFSNQLYNKTPTEETSNPTILNDNKDHEIPVETVDDLPLSISPEDDVIVVDMSVSVDNTTILPNVSNNIEENKYDVNNSNGKSSDVEKNSILVGSPNNLIHDTSRFSMCLDDSPLPLFQRMGLKTATQNDKVVIISISSEDEPIKTSEIINETERSSDPVHQTNQVDEKKVVFKENLIEIEYVNISSEEESETIKDTKRQSDPVHQTKKLETKKITSKQKIKRTKKTSIFDEEDFIKSSDILETNRLSDPNQQTKKSRLKVKDSEKEKVNNDTIKPKPPRKRKSKDQSTESDLSRNKKRFETPEKQSNILNPFTPLPDYRAMATPLVVKQSSMYGIKQKLSKNLLIKALERIHSHTHQIDTGGSDSDTLESSDDSPYESTENNSVDSKENLPSTDNLKDNDVLISFMKTHYFKDILTYKPIDIKQVWSHLKENGINTSLSKLNDFFDDQCILVTNEDKNKRYNRPLKASKLIL